MALGGRMEQFRALRGAFAEQLQQALAQRHAGRLAEGEEGVQRAAAGGFGGFAGGTLEQPGGQRRVQVEDRVADGHAATRAQAGTAEDAQRQVLQGKVGMPIGGGDPATSGGWLVHGVISVAG